jgi:hypothetical protein
VRHAREADSVLNAFLFASALSISVEAIEVSSSSAGASLPRL